MLSLDFYEGVEYGIDKCVMQMNRLMQLILDKDDLNIKFFVAKAAEAMVELQDEVNEIIVNYSEEEEEGEQDELE